MNQNNFNQIVKHYIVGCRPVTFASKKHPSRAKRKAMERSETGRFFHGPYYIDNETPEAFVTCFIGNT